MAVPSTRRVMHFRVLGDPAAQGSKRVVNGKLIEDSKRSRPWRDRVAEVALDHRPSEPLTDAVQVKIVFRFLRPKTHFGTGRRAGILKSNAPIYKVSTPDVDKLCRLVLDALVIAGVMRSDAQVAVLQACKVYGNEAGVEVEIRDGL